MLTKYFFSCISFVILLKSEILSQNFLGPHWNFSHGFLRSEFIQGISVGLYYDKHFCQLNAVGVECIRNT